MPHFFIQKKDISENKIRITEKSTFHHLARVMRAKEGETLLLVDENQTQYSTKIINITNEFIEAEIIKKTLINHSLKLNLYLAQSVLKNDAQNFVIQKSTELGVKGIIPVCTDNCVIKESVVDSKIEKWKKIASEAVKQCERTDIPQILKREKLKDILGSTEYKIKLACVERSDKTKMKKVLQNLQIEKNDKILVIIGPEGGFSHEELNLLEKSDIHKVSLGNLILRAETAAVSALSNIIYELENE